MLFLVIVLGLIIGSFIGAYTWRLPKGISINDGRSKCPKCGYLIYWYDNIPVFSFLLLHGKCRHCGKKISIRYPLIELTTALLFAGLFLFRENILGNVPFLIFPAALALLAISIAITVIDIEHQVIPDELIWISLGLTLLCFFVFSGSSFYERLLTAGLSGLFLLLLNIATKGKGMGLGDVKYALFPGFLLGFPLSIVWIFISFLSGAVVGLLMLWQKQVKLKSRIAFGPFLVLGLWICLFWGTQIKNVIFPIF